MLRSLSLLVAIGILSLVAIPNHLSAQGFGGGGGFGGYGSGESDDRSGASWNPETAPHTLALETALNVITVDGTAHLRVKPEGIRVVLAVTSEAETAAECQSKNAYKVGLLRKAWNTLDIPDADIVEDFINVLPVYQWQVVTRDGQEFRIQEPKGFRQQTNLHVAVANEERALAAIGKAFGQGVTEIVTFDYWSSQLDQQKEKARAAALKAAQAKAETLLAVFEKSPKVINVQEKTQVFLPHSLYRTYENVLEEEVEYNNSWRDKPMIKAYRPKMTFFHGLESRADIHPGQPAMHPEIAVISTVRLYYQSPAEKTVNPKGADELKHQRYLPSFSKK